MAVQKQIRLEVKTIGASALVKLVDSPALSDTDSEASLQQYASRLEALHAIDQAILRNQSLLEIVETVFIHLQRLIPHEHTTIALFDFGADEALVFTSNRHGKIRHEERRVTLMNHEAYLELMHQGRTVLIDDLLVIRRTLTCEQLIDMEVRGAIFSPLLYASELLGSLNLGATEPDFFQLEQIAIVREIADQLAIAFQHARLFEVLNRRARETAALLATSQVISASLELNVALEVVTEEVKSLLHADGSRIHLLEPDGETLRCVIARHERADKVKALTLKLGQGLTGKVAQTGQPRLVRQAAHEPDALQVPGTPDVLECLALAPLKVRNQVIGVMTVFRLGDDRPFALDDLELLGAFATQAAVAIANARLYSDLEQSLQQEQAARMKLVQAEKLAVMGRLVASVAHELNNPLQVIQNVLYMIRREKGITSMMREDVEVAWRESRRMAELIARLRETYRPTKTTAFRPISLNSLVEEVEQLIGSHLRHKRMRFAFEPDPASPQAKGLHDQLKQVLLNLCLNAVEAMVPGGQLTIRTGHDPTTQQVYLAVTDNGAGVEPADLPNIFDPFFTTKDTGTGLGLAITYDIVKWHHGRIEVESQPGEQTTFTVWLPSTVHESDLSVEA